MAKRMTDTQKWKKPFFEQLGIEMKLFWIYLLDDCNHAGIWQVNLRLANFLLGTNLTQEEILISLKDKIQVIDDGNKWYIPSFIQFQYPNGLSTENNVTKSILKELKKYNLTYGVGEGFTNPYSTPQDKDKDIDKDKDKELDKESVGLLYDDKHKDFDKLVLMFPNGKRDYDPHSLTIWENLSQRDKDLCLQLVPHYVEFHTKTGKEKYIKNIRKFLEEGFYKQLNENQSRYLGKKVIIQGTDYSEKEKLKKLELKKKLWG